jgi:hypothetical protein
MLMTALTAPPTLTKSRHWVVHKNKAPVGREGMNGWNQAENWFTYNEAIEKLNGGDYDGLGFIVARESGRKDRQIIGGDLDNCRDPITGEGSAWAVKILEDLDTCSAPSYSGCGYRFFCLGKLPDGLNEVEGHGADDLPNDMKEHILAAKPSAREKLEKYGPAEVWNGIEIYEDGPKHLTITGQWLPADPVELQYRVVELMALIAPYLKEAPRSASPPRAPGPTRKASGSKFPHLNILDVIDTSGFSASGSELVGSHPGMGSTTGANLKVNVGKNSWCSFHNFQGGTAPGGDPWVWLACECGAVPWEEAGSGVLTDPIVVSTTMMHAAKRGLIPETPDIVAAFKRSKAKAEEEKSEEPKGPTVIDAIKALAGVCDGAKSQDGIGFNKFDREANEDLIEKVLSGEELSPREEKKAHTFLKKYKKQLKKLGIDYDQIGHIARDDGEGCENALAEIIDRIPAWIEEHHFKTVADTKKIVTIQPPNQNPIFLLKRHES